MPHPHPKQPAILLLIHHKDFAMGIKENPTDRSQHISLNSAYETASNAFFMSAIAILVAGSLVMVNFWTVTKVLRLQSSLDSFNESQADLKAYSMANRDIINAYVEGLSKEHELIKHDLGKVLPTYTTYEDPAMPRDDDPHAVKAWAEAKAKLLERRIANDRKAHEVIEYYHRSATKQIEDARNPIKPLEN